MSTVVSIMDREGWDSNTDNIVIADRLRFTLLWVPRDLWVEHLSTRINAAFKRGGHESLLGALSSLGFHVKHSLCLRREATEKWLAGITVTVPVDEPIKLWYPLEPHSLVQDGKKAIDFDPPREVLSGERLHQWIGARRSRTGPSSDLVRIGRQQVFIGALLQQKPRPSFGSLLEDPSLVSISSPGALEDLRRVRSWWRFRVVADVRPKMIEGKDVLVRVPGAKTWSG